MDPITRKARRLLQIVCAAFFLILFRVWHLGTVQREDKLIEAQKPQQRQILLRANRGTICDRFGIPLAVNRICYNASIYYGQIAQVPVVSWKTDENGQRTRVYARREYIRELSCLLGRELELEPERIEDLIHAKASLFPHVPYVIKAGLTEGTYYRLRMLEKDWLGLHAEIGSERFYPLGKSAAHVIGTMGAISQKEYLSIAEELRQLQQIVGEQELAGEEGSFEKERLLELKEKAYTLNDLVGKGGIEGRFEEELRGVFGKTTFEVDQKGRFVREISGGKSPAVGKQIRLTISSELQQYAEQLLAQAETLKEKKLPKQPWIRGGAIVAIEPRTGEILAMASDPSFDPNDFIPSSNPEMRNYKQSNVNRWIESGSWLGAIWEGREPLTKDQFLSWDLFLDLVLPADGPLRAFFQKVSDVKTAVQIQEDFATLCYFSKGGDPLTTEIQHPARKRLLTLISELPANDQLFAIDLCRTCVDATRITDALLPAIGSMKLSTYFSLSQAFHRLEREERKKFQASFHKEQFRHWKNECQKEFLQLKRKEEKEKGMAVRPYIDYLDQKEKELFSEFWNEARLEVLKQQIDQAPILKKAVSSDLLVSLFHSFRSFEQLEKREKELATLFYPKGGLGYSRSYAFQASAPQGSLFKLVSGYEALRQGVSLSLIDEQGQAEKGLVVAYDIQRNPYPRIYKGGRLPRSSTQRIGKIDVVGALEQSSNPFFSIIAGDYLQSPNDLAEAAYRFGFGARTGISLPGEAIGVIPDDLERNKTGLYSFAIGQHTLLATPLQSALFLSCLANGGKLLKPQIILGVEPSCRSTLPMPPSIRNPLLEGMDRAVWGAKGSARPTVIKSLLSNPVLMHDYLSLQHQMLGKTSTAEVLWNPFRNPSAKPFLHKHTWFGAISFTSIKRDQPELIVIVMQRFGESGKEGAPIAAQVIRKWREIVASQNKQSSP
jgi:cell division protein FtsI/penicillin-binding protein 2